MPDLYLLSYMKYYFSLDFRHRYAANINFIMKILLILCLILMVSSLNNDCQRLNYLPMPKKVSCGGQSMHLPDPCRLLFHVKLQEAGNEHISELIAFQLKKTLHCNIPNIVFSQTIDMELVGFIYSLDISITDPQLKSVFITDDERYELTILKSGAYLSCITYVGLVRGLQTFMQTINCPKHKYLRCTIANLPIDIEDEPAFVYRGLMIDSSRHFLPLSLIFETLDAMMYNKMNILHWHIVDEDSFPLILDGHPELAKYGAFSQIQTYSAKQAREVVKYAMRRGVRVIPELDTPGHAASWGLAPENKDVACNFGSGFMGPLDVTLDKTYTLVKQVFSQIFQIFPDPMVHLGGDEVVLTCLANKTEFIKLEGIRQIEIEIQYRRKQRKMLMEINPQKKFMYWINTIDVLVEEGDTVHWWGYGLPKTKNPVIISQFGPFYLDMGVGNYNGVTYGTYQTWFDLYNKNIGQMIADYNNKENVLGAEVCLWSQLSNKYIHHMKIWIRTSAFAERVWNVGQFNAKPDFLGRITSHQRLMNRRGIPTAGATSQQCESFPQFC